MEKTHLFLIHFAGGNIYSFRFLEPWLKDLQLTPLELPGRGMRINEPVLRNFKIAADDLFRQIITKHQNGPLILYGHSMGAYLALAVTDMLEKSGLYPLGLIVSGNAGPGIYGRIRRYLMNKIDFIEQLRRLGGISEEVFSNEDLFNFFEPILRADFEISENNDMLIDLCVDAPIFAMMGNEEERVSDITNWARFTRADFKYKVFPGNHFFIHDHKAIIASVIRSYATSLGSREIQL